MDIYTLLKQDHEKLATLLDKLVACSEGNDPSWKRVLEEIRSELIPHSRAEESLFYNPIRERIGKSSGIAHSFAEHATAEIELRTLQAMKVIDVSWTALAKKLREDLTHHVEEEETKMFSSARKVISPEEALEIGQAFSALKPKIEEEGMMKDTADLVGNLLKRQPRTEESKVEKHGA